MTYKFYFSILFTVIFLITSACTRDYKKEMEQILSKHNAVPVYYSLDESNHFIIYHDYKSVYYENFDSARVLLFDKNKKYIIKEFKPEFSKSGELRYKEYVTGPQEVHFSFLDNLDSRPCENSATYACIMRCKRIIGIEDGPLNHIKYLYDIQSPDTLIKVETDAEWKGDHYEFCIYETMWNFPGFYNYYREMAEDACYNSLFEDKNMLDFGYKISFDTLGNISMDTDEFDGPKIITSGKYYNKHGVVKDFDINAEDSESGPFIASMPINNIGTDAVTDFFNKIVDFYHRALKIKEAVNIIENSIDLSKLSYAFKNRVKAEELIEKEFNVYLKIETIDKAEGLFDISGHKYKIRSFALEAFDEWLSGYDVVAYTNDESFIDLEYPCEVIMKCTLVSGSTRKFVFKKCELLLAN